VAQARRHVLDLDHERVTGRDALHRHRSGENVDPGTAVRFRDGVPDGPDAVVHQEVGRVAGVVGDGLDIDDRAGVDLDHRSLVAIDVAPVAGVGRGRERVRGGHGPNLRSQNYARISAT
jgi:hypothetical protein